MSKYTEIYGVDISKAVFDVYSISKGHVQYENDAKGFKLFKSSILKGVLVVMEATVLCKISLHEISNKHHMYKTNLKIRWIFLSKPKLSNEFYTS